MKCAHCGRYISKPSATVRTPKESFNGMRWVEVDNFGPECAKKLGLLNPPKKAKREKMKRVSNKIRSKAFWAAQADLFGHTVTV